MGWVDWHRPASIDIRRLPGTWAPRPRRGADRSRRPCTAFAQEAYACRTGTRYDTRRTPGIARRARLSRWHADNRANAVVAWAGAAGARLAFIAARSRCARAIHAHAQSFVQMQRAAHDPGLTCHTASR